MTGRIQYCPYCGNDEIHVFWEVFSGQPVEGHENQAKARCSACKSRFDIKDITIHTGYVPDYSGPDPDRDRKFRAEEEPEHEGLRGPGGIW